MSTALALPDYRDIGCTHWLRARRDKYDPIGRALADGHYSRRKPGSPQFMPPGETIVLVSHDQLSVWGWWRPHPRSGLRAMNAATRGSPPRRYRGARWRRCERRWQSAKGGSTRSPARTWCGFAKS